jgi:NAD(P)-dependent dehydrogenase (short-subunit alcohol dehydrogenase family)
MAAARTVIVTGCSSGIGRATALDLVQHGWTVYATARRLESVAELEAEGCRTLALDVTDERSMRDAVDAVLDREGRIGALVNNAGYSQSGAIETVSPEDLRRQFETNVFGLMRMSQLVLPSMREAGAGRIVNIGSMGGRLTFPGGGVYHATKYAVEALSDALRFEVAGFGVRVALIEPGLIRTGFAEAAVATVDHDEGPYAAFNAHVAHTTVSTYESGPIGKLGGDPEDVAKVVRKALETKRPRARYTVTPSAKLLIAQRRVTPDGAWDRLMAAQFPRPGR